MILSNRENAKGKPSLSMSCLQAISLVFAKLHRILSFKKEILNESFSRTAFS